MPSGAPGGGARSSGLGVDPGLGQGTLPEAAAAARTCLRSKLSFSGLGAGNGALHGLVGEIGPHFYLWADLGLQLRPRREYRA